MIDWSRDVKIFKGVSCMPLLLKIICFFYYLFFECFYGGTFKLISFFDLDCVEVSAVIENKKQTFNVNKRKKLNFNVKYIKRYSKIKRKFFGFVSRLNYTRL